MSTSSSTPRTPGPWPLRSEAELIADQLAGIASWTSARPLREAVAASVTLSREMRLDLKRRMEVRRREQAGLLARASYQLEQGDRVLGRRPRAVLVHRNSWLSGKVADRLQALGVQVIGRFEDGADATGAVVVEQPEIVLVEDRLPTLSGLEVLERATRFAPRTLVGAQLLDADERDIYLEAGAQAVFTRRVPPEMIADQLVDCLAGPAGPLSVR
ncbi:MAG TPA: hypothetical protein VFR07_18065 [Mycobacteriales bacterium]|nr:hypothetical protein [Mycobacteriales bacterium]